MRIPVLLVNSASALVLLSSLDLVSSRFDEPVRVIRQRHDFKTALGDDGVSNRSPQAVDQAPDRVNQPYEYGFGPAPDDPDSTAAEADGPSMTSRSGASWNATSSGTWASETSDEPASESGGEDDGYPQETDEPAPSTTESPLYSYIDATPTADADDGYPRETPKETSSNSEDAYPSGDVSATGGEEPSSSSSTGSDTDESGQGPSAPAATSILANGTSTEEPVGQVTATDLSPGASSPLQTQASDTSVPPFANTTVKGNTTTTASSLAFSATVDGNATSSDGQTLITRTLGTPGNQEPPVLTPTGFPTWTISSSISQAPPLSSPGPPFPGNDTIISSIIGTGTVGDGQSTSNGAFLTTLLLNTTSSADAASQTGGASNVTESGQTGSGIVMPTIRRTSTIGEVTVAAPVSTSNATISGSITDTLSASTSPSSNATASLSFMSGPVTSASATEEPPFSTGNSSAIVGGTAASGSSTVLESPLSSDSDDNGTIMTPSWNDSSTSDAPPVLTSGATELPAVNATTTAVTPGNSTSLSDGVPSFPTRSIDIPWSQNGTVIAPTSTSAHVLTSVIQPSTRPPSIPPFPNATDSETPGSPGTQSWTLTGTDVFPSSPPLPSLPVPPVESIPPFPQPNSTSSVLPGTGISSGFPASGTLSTTGSLSFSTSGTSLSSNFTTGQPSSTEAPIPAPLPPITLDNTTITFPPVTDIPSPSSSVPVPFPMPNVTVSRTFNGTGFTQVPVPTPPQTSASVDATISSITSGQSVLTSSDGTITATALVTNTTRIPWPSSNTTIPWPISSTTRWPGSGNTTAPWPPMNTTVPANSTLYDPDSTGTLFDGPSESSEAPSNATSGVANATSLPTLTFTLPVEITPFPLSNSTRFPQPTGGLPSPSASDDDSASDVISTIDGSIVISKTVIQPPEDPVRTFSLGQNASATVNGTLIVSGTVIDDTTWTTQINSTATATGNATWGISGTVTRTSRSVIIVSGTTTVTNAAITIRPSPSATPVRTLTLTPVSNATLTGTRTAANRTVTVRPTSTTTLSLLSTTTVTNANGTVTVRPSPSDTLVRTLTLVNTTITTTPGSNATLTRTQTVTNATITVTPTSSTTLVRTLTLANTTTIVTPEFSVALTRTLTVTNATITVTPSSRATQIGTLTGAPDSNATLVRTTTVKNATVTVTPVSRTTVIRTRTSTYTPSTGVTVTAAPVDTSPCITITITRGNVTEKITKTITQPHPDLTKSAWLTDQTDPVTEEKTPCTSTTKTPLTTSCTSDLMWLNGTLSTMVVTEPVTSSAAMTANMTSTTPGGVSLSASLTSVLVQSSSTSSNATWFAGPGGTTLLTSTTREPGVAPFNRVPTATASSDEPLPSSPNYPWGGTGPLHRHYNVTEMGSGAESSRGLLGRGLWSLARKGLDWLEGLWHGGEGEAFGEGDEYGEGGYSMSEDGGVDEGDLVGGK